MLMQVSCCAQSKLLIVKIIMAKASPYIRIDSQIINGDCLSVMNNIPNASIDCILTDPPYNLGLFMHERNTNLAKMRENQFAYAGWDNIPYEEWYENMRLFLNECKRVLKPRGTFLCFMAISITYLLYFRIPLSKVIKPIILLINNDNRKASLINSLSGL